MFHQEQSQKTEDSAINGDLSELNMEDSESNAVKVTKTLIVLRG